jgi:hypothetical protein
MKIRAPRKEAELGMSCERCACERPRKKGCNKAWGSWSEKAINVKRHKRSTLRMMSVTLEPLSERMVFSSREKSKLGKEGNEERGSKEMKKSASWGGKHARRRGKEDVRRVSGKKKCIYYQDMQNGGENALVFQ